MITFKQFVSESINDKGIFKAVFVVGLPGAGKSYTISQIKGEISPVIVNTDRSAEFLSKKWGKEIKSDTWADFKDTAHRMTQNSLSNYIDGMLPLFVDGTSNDVSNILHRMGILESLGYDVGVVFVHSNLDVAIERAKERAKNTGRHVDEDFIRKIWDHNQENAAYLKSKASFFKDVVNDTDGLSNEELTEAYKAVQSFFKQPVKNPIGKRNIEVLKEKGLKYLTPEIINRDVLKKKIEGWYKS